MMNARQQDSRERALGVETQSGVLRPQVAKRWATGLPPGAVSLAAGLLLWKVLSLLVPGGPTLLPAPEVVVARLWDLASRGLLWRHAGVTLAEAGLGFLLAAACGLVLAYPVAKSRLLEEL